MNFIQKIWTNIVTSNDKQFIDKISELEATLKQKDEVINDIEFELDTEVENYIALKKQYDLVQEQNNTLKDELETYKKVEVPYTIPTDIIDTSKFPYMPGYKSYFLNPMTGKLEFKLNPMTPSKFYREWTDEMYKFVWDNIKNIKDPDKIKIKLRALACNRVEYKSDILVKSNGTVVLGENWKPAHVTWDDKSGDCEDSTILFICFCAIAGIPADEVFNATGYYLQGTKKTGHSFGVCKFKDGNWYVMETTSIRTPMKFLGNSQYIIKNDMMNGLSNWAISGKAKKEQF